MVYKTLTKKIIYHFNTLQISDININNITGEMCVKSIDFSNNRVVLLEKTMIKVMIYPSIDYYKWRNVV